MADVRAKLLSEAEPASLFQLRAEVMGRKLVRFIENRKIPAGSAKLVLKLLIARKLVKANDQSRVVIERVSAWRCLLQHRRVNMELKAEFLKQLVAPLFDKASWRHDHDAV